MTVTESYLGLDKSERGCQSQLEIKGNPKPNATECLPKCEGVLVASYFKTKTAVDAAVVAPKLMEQYNNYKQFVEFPGNLRGEDKLTTYIIY